MENQIINTNNNEVTKVEIHSIEEMDAFLGELQQTASESVAAALAAQLQVIRYVSSPQLINSSFDLLFQNLKKSINYAESPQQQAKIKEKGVLMIQNYVFFMNAKLKYAIEDNRREGERLFNEAGMQLSKSVIEVASLATGPAGTAMRVVVAKNLFENKEAVTGLFANLINFFSRKMQAAKKQAEFYESIHSLILKLDKHKELIGQSDLMSGLIHNYAEELTTFAVADTAIEIENLEPEVSDWARRMRNRFITTISIVVLFYFFDWLTGYGLLFIGFVSMFLVSSIIRYSWKKSEYNELTLKLGQDYRDIYRNYMRIAEEFEET